jgi:metal-responsive CopG/Arc/MetJ family transcriptional regulator
MNNPTKEKMVSFLLPTQILETINDIRLNEGQSSRSSVIRKLVNSGLKNYYQYLENNDLVRKQ